MPEKNTVRWLASHSTNIAESWLSTTSIDLGHGPPRIKKASQPLEWRFVGARRIRQGIRLSTAVPQIDIQQSPASSSNRKASFSPPDCGGVDYPAGHIQFWSSECFGAGRSTVLSSQDCPFMPR
ncbi:hypothetical protein HCEG_03173 [Histoplasma capsulatum var. duboisii H88]|uniref:Uncharacterized protein n=2 Tax=Ajellomyces capsulatus TaxID=5037 RepID=F0UC12_AJEC8|nr:hypothetical protein HCDG_03398 [Histoplasma capsulatum H143]EGC43958.1 hypothetical protein HCEG_03173 [Histoplasma capsulatum var. duboisii H88]